jgi:uncharacterized pyridoxal phosphate-containing UPF0001 family protein
MTDFITKNYEEIVNGMAQIVAEAPLAPPQPRLIAASKTQPYEKIKTLLDRGHRVFGENRYQEAKERWEGVLKCYNTKVLSFEETSQPSTARREARGGGENPHSKINLHYIGALQSNKAAEVVALFDEIHSLDRPKLAEALAKAMRDQGRNLPLYIQINTGEEPQKAGILPKDAPDFIRYCREELALSIIGLMCIPPASVNPAPHFAFLRNLAKEHSLPRLSMGMSDDWREALRMGATDIRIGSALFGARH